jgi:uncharacterized protein DUF2786
MSEAHREAIAHRIRSLLAKTVENGATEAEALAAAAKARQIMDAHRLTQSDIEIQAEPIDKEFVERGSDQKMTATDLILYGLDAYCGVKTWFNATHHNGKFVRRLVIFGLRSDVEMARYIYQLVDAAIERETKLFAANPANRGFDATETRRINTSFRIGMARRIRERLHEMARELDTVAKTATGTALVVVKNAVVDDAYKALGLRLGRGSSGPRARDHGAYAAGKAAGDRVNLNRPIGGAPTGRLT